MFINRSATRQFMLVTGLTATCVLALGSMPGTAKPVLRVAPVLATSPQTAAVESTRVQVVVGPVVAVTLDGNGHPIGAITNTFRPPIATDTFTIYGKHGKHGKGETAVPASVIEAVIRMARGGDWTRPGTWHELAPSRTLVRPAGGRRRRAAA
jgi:hypothetical protein